MKRIFLARDFQEKPDGQSTIIFSNFSMTREDRRKSAPDLTKKQLVKILRSEMALLRVDFKSTFTNLSDRADETDRQLKQIRGELHILQSDVSGLRLQLHQNHTSFITDQQDHERRISVLETHL